jgi:PGF-CTERM protein
MISYSERTAAVLLVLMVTLSAVAGTVALSGTVAPDAVAEESTTTMNVTVDVHDVDTGDGADQVVYLDFPDSLDLSGSAVGNYTVTDGNVSRTLGTTAIDTSTNNVTVRLPDDGGTAGDDVEVQFDVTAVVAPTVNADRSGEVSLTVDDDASDSTGDDVDDVAISSFRITDAGTSEISTDEPFDAKLASNDSRWIGQDLVFQDDTASNVVYALHRAPSNGSDGRRVGDFVAEIPLDANGEAVFSSDVADGGDYVVTDTDGRVVEFEDGNVTARGVAVDDADFSLTDQTFSAAFGETRVDNEDTDVFRDLELSSNRGRYTVEISADGLDEDELRDVFDEFSDGSTAGDRFVRTYTDDGTDYVVMRAGTDTDLRADFRDVDPGIYTFHVEVSDTDIDAEASILVGDREADRRFGQSVYRAAAGDTVDVTLELDSTDSGYVFVGSREANVFERVAVEDDNDDGRVTVTVNTFLLGRDAANVSGYTETDELLDATYQSDADVVTQELRPRAAIDHNDDGDTSDATEDPSVVPTYQGLVEIPAQNADSDFDVTFTGLADPAAPDEYSLVVSESADVRIDDDGEAEVVGEQDTAILSLSNGELASVDTLTAPEGDSDGVLERATRTDTVAQGDTLLVRLDASGLSGLLERTDDDYDSAGFQNNSGLYVVVRERDDDLNREPAVLDLDSNDVSVVETPDDDAYYLVFEDTDAPDTLRGSVEPGRYVVEFVQTGPNADVLEDDLSGYYDVPASELTTSGYLADEEVRTVSAEFTMEERGATFRGLTDAGVLEVPRSPETTVSAATNLAPGTEVTVRLTGENALYSRTVEVSPARRVSATFDVRDTSAGEAMTAQVRLDGDALTTVDAVVVAETATARTPTATATATEPTPTPTPTETPAATPEPTEPSTSVQTATSRETTSGDGTGFGAVAALVALLAAALLGVRRD